jgi:hypothetical protein
MGAMTIPHRAHPEGNLSIVYSDDDDQRIPNATVGW